MTGHFDGINPNAPFDCPNCPDFTGTADAVYVHLMGTHRDQRRVQTVPHANRRRGDVQESPWVQRAHANKLPAGGPMPLKGRVS